MGKGQGRTHKSVNMKEKVDNLEFMEVKTFAHQKASLGSLGLQGGVGGGLSWRLPWLLRHCLPLQCVFILARTSRK